MNIANSMKGNNDMFLVANTLSYKMAVVSEPTVRSRIVQLLNR